MKMARYYLASYLIRLGLFIMPSSRYKTELLQVLYTLKEKVIAEVSLKRKLQNAKPAKEGE